MNSKLRKYFHRLKKYGFVVLITDILYDRGKQILPYSIYLWLMKQRDKSIEKYINQNVPLPSFIPCSDTPLKEMGFPIWFMWLQGEGNMPDIVRLCYQSAKKHCAKGNVILLTKENLGKYVNLPSFIIQKHNEGKISTTHLSDIVRFYLLGTYGGGGWMPPYCSQDNCPRNASKHQLSA